MQNSKEIPAGATVYFCRRDLGMHYTSLMVIEKATIQKRTPLGYKFVCNHNKHGWLHTDEHFYISENRKEVVDAVLKDIVAATERVHVIIGELEKAADNL